MIGRFDMVKVHVHQVGDDFVENHLDGTEMPLDVGFNGLNPVGISTGDLEGRRAFPMPHYRIAGQRYNPFLQSDLLYAANKPCS
jgi:hypothetical protein